MATREENLTKINDELEKLSDEQLEQVAGGIRRRPEPRVPRRPHTLSELQRREILQLSMGADDNGDT